MNINHNITKQLENLQKNLPEEIISFPNWIPATGKKIAYPIGLFRYDRTGLQWPLGGVMNIRRGVNHDEAYWKINAPTPDELEPWTGIVEFVLYGTDFAVIDLDHVFDDSGQWGSDKARRVYEYILSKTGATYREYSQSKHGLHILLKATPNCRAGGTVSGLKSINGVKIDGFNIELFYHAKKKICLTGDLYECEPRATIASGAAVDDLLTELSPPKKPIKLKPRPIVFSVDRESDSALALAMLDAIPPNELSDQEWLVTSTAAKNAGIDFDAWDNWCKRDPDRYNERENKQRWESFAQNSAAVGALANMAKRYNFDFKSFYRDWKQQHPDSYKPLTWSGDTMEQTTTTAKAQDNIDKAGLIWQKLSRTAVFKRVNTALDNNYNLDDYKPSRKKAVTADIIEKTDGAGVLANIIGIFIWLGTDKDTINKIIGGRALARAVDYEHNQAIIWEKADKLVGKQRQGQTYEYKKPLPDAGLLPLCEYNQTAIGNAERLAYLANGDLIFVPNHARFYQWTGNHWSESVSKDHADIGHFCHNALRLTGDAASNICFPPNTLCTVWELQAKGELKSFAEKSENHVTKMITEATRLEKMQVTADKFDTDIMLFNCQNVTLNLQTQGTYEPRRADYITKVAAVEYDPNAKSELWENTVAEILPDAQTRHYVQKFLGYCLSGSVREEKFLFAYGDGGCGKGTLFETVGKILGDYASEIPIDCLLSSRNDGDGERATPQLAKMQGKRLTLAGESGQGRRLHDARIKALTGGDKRTSRKLYGDAFDYIPTDKLILLSNFRPSVQDAADGGLKRRLVLVPFNHHFENPDRTLKEKLMEPENRSAILMWLLDGYDAWQREGLDELPPEIAQATAKFWNEADDLGNFIDDYCVVATDKRVGVNRLRNMFNDTMKRNIGRGAFSEAMERRGYTKRKCEEGICFLGLDLK